MNLNKFIQFIDSRANGLDKEELLELIHDIAHRMPGEGRRELAEVLENIEAEEIDTRDITPQGASGTADREEILKEAGRLKELFAAVRSGEHRLHAGGYDDYSLGYWSGSWVWEYEDPMGIGKTFEEGCRLVQCCVNNRLYQEAAELLKLIMRTEIQVETPGKDFYIDLKKLTEEGLAEINLYNLALYALYTAYQVLPCGERAQGLHRLFFMPCFKNVRLEHMLGLGTEELDGLPEFWDEWIGLLSETDGDVEGRLLEEAIAYRKGEAGMLETARVVYEKHPLLYLHVIERLDKSHDYKRQMEIGKEALERIDSCYVIRGQIALKTAEAALHLGQYDAAEDCWLEAFASSTTAVNYMRLVVESREPGRYREAAERIIASVGQDMHESQSLTGELERNSMSEHSANILGFLSGDFESAIERYSRVRQFLGWTGEFIKCGLALFLLLLLKDDDWKEGATRMEDTLLYYMNFRAEEYYKGTVHQLACEKSGSVVLNNREVFKRCFIEWKRSHPLTGEQERRYVSVLEGLIDRRVKTIVTGKYRDRYGSVAALAAALGEVKESMGETGAKALILNKYREAFPDYSSFHEELRAYGMDGSQ